MQPVSRDFTFDLRKVRILRELSERTTITATAEALHLTPSAVSQQVAALSREVGAPLLVRYGRGVRLTPQARLLLGHAALLNAQMERARADMLSYSSGEIGQVVVGAFATAISGLIAPAVARLSDRRPGLHLTVREVEAPDCFTNLDSGELDVVVTVDYRNGPPHNDPRYYRCHLVNDAFVVALPSSHRLGTEESINLADLSDEIWVLGAVGGACHEVSLAACTAAGFAPNIRHQTNDWNAVLALVAAGAGVALIPDLALAPHRYEGIVLRPVSEPQRPMRHIYAAVRAGAERSPAVTPVLDLLQEIALHVG